MLDFLTSFIAFKLRFRFYTTDMIEKYQTKKAKNIVKYAIKNSKFFREYYKECNIQDVWNFPTLNKKIMMDNLTDYNTLGLKKEDLTEFVLNVEKTRDFSSRFKGLNVSMSSGTSGNKGIVITTIKEEKYLKAMYVARLTLPKGEKLNCAFILRVSIPAFNFNLLGNRVTYVSQLQPMESIIKQLEEIDPNVVSAPPSMLKLLAAELKKGSLKIKPKLLYSYAEVLYPDVRNFLQKVFNCQIHQIYQGSEGCYAVTCKYGTVHINEDVVALQLLDKNDNPAPYGEPCYKLIVTDLHKTSQPIIRYELNDIITLGKYKCKCGSNFRVIEQIQGRADDMFWGIRKDTNKLHFIFQDYISRAIISSSDYIEEYQAIQETPKDITLNLILNEKADRKQVINSVSMGIKKVFSSYNCVEPKIKVKFKPPQLNENSRKLIRIKCNFKGDYH